MNERTIKLNDILDVANAARDYGYDDDVLMFSLYEWAKPVTDADIEAYATGLANSEGYGEEDKEEALERLTEWRNRYSR